MENIVAVSPASSAPYATTVIPLFLASITGLRYRTLNCMECGQEFIERNNDSLWRLNDNSQPAEITLDGSAELAMCGNCQQQYLVQVSLNMILERSSIPLHMQPQSVYITVDSFKQLRYLHCLECGRTFSRISDRINQVVDNRIPSELLNLAKIGPVEALCRSQHCGQTWDLIV